MTGNTNPRTTAVNLNADVGESYGSYQMGDDAALIPIIGSANIACGFHGGDPLVMQQALELAMDNQVSIGAHPSFPDLQGFGRRKMVLSNEELRATLWYQVAAIDGVAKAMGTRLTHVKPHGAMNNMACEDAVMASVIASAIKEYRSDLILLAPAGSQLAIQGAMLGLTIANEIFADRAYQDDGNLVPRSEPGAVLHDVTDCVKQVLACLEQGGIVTQSGKLLKTSIHSICVHGDNAHSVEVARNLHRALAQAGYTLKTLPELVA
ncbi:MAG: UPF0271 protein [Saprospiraceae bacterium]|jgi:UPF0271 protein